MNDYGLRLTPEAMNIFTKLHPEIKKWIKNALKAIVISPHSGKELHSDLAGFRSYRTKRYRIIYRINDNERFIDVIHIGHRKSVYAQLQTLIKRSNGSS